MTKKITALIDADMIKYGAAFAGQKSSIIVTHPTLNIHEEFKSRTEFYGHYSKKSGGWLSTYNEGRDSIILPDEFTIEDKIIAEPLANVLHTTKCMYNNLPPLIGATSHKGFIGKGECFRVERSTLLKYKDRPAPKPIHVDAVSDYLEHKLKCEVVTHIETDDRIVQEAYGKKNKIVIGEDKDYYGTPVLFFNVNRPEMGIVDCTGFGKLWLHEKINSKGKKETEVRGHGRLFLYYQVCSSDDIDNYSANCFSDKTWGSKSAYKLLVDCKDDKEAFEKMKECFQLLYPEPKKVIGWKGVEIEIDWLYVLQECFTMARMLRVKDEPEVILRDVFDKLGVTI